ncbi:MAG: YtxH domain-containing protein [Pyrinomonadaceae bacterium]
MNRAIAVIGALGAGAALMYLFDPEGGRRRRAQIRDKATGATNDIRNAITSKATDLQNRAKGMLHEAKSAVNTENGGRNTATTQQENPA